jgi:hypothetical protein
MHWKRRLLTPASAAVLLIAISGTTILSSGVAGAQGIKPGSASYLRLDGDPAVPGGVQTHQSAVVDIRSSQSTNAMQKEVLTAAEINLVQARAQGLSTCTMTYGEYFRAMSEGSPISTIIKNVKFEDSQYKQGAPAWCETVTLSHSSVNTETPVVTTTTGSNGTTTTTSVTTVRRTVSTVVRILIPKACGNIGLISTSTSTSQHSSVKQTSVTVTPPPTTTTTTPPPTTTIPPPPPPPPPPPAPAFSCSTLVVSPTTGNSVEATLTYVSNETPVTVSFQMSSSGSDDVTIAGNITTAGTATASYTYLGGPGTYTVAATVLAAGTDSTGPTTCSYNVTIPCPKTPPPPCPPPVVPPCTPPPPPCPPVKPPCTNPTPKPPCTPTWTNQQQPPCSSSNQSPCQTHSGGQNGNSPCDNSHHSGNH